MDVIRGVIFDKDGTLFDFCQTWEVWAARLIARLAGNDVSKAERIGAAIGYDVPTQSFASDSVVIAGTQAEIAAALAPALQDMPDLVTLLNEEAAEAPQVEAVPLRDLFTALRQGGLRLGLATNDGEAPARAHLRAARVEDLFDFIAGYDSGFGGKPAPGQLLAFCEATGLAAADVVMVGDSLHDLLAGRAAGMRTVGVLTGMATRTDLAPFADIVLPDIGALPHWLETFRAS